METTIPNLDPLLQTAGTDLESSPSIIRPGYYAGGTSKKV